MIRAVLFDMDGLMFDTERVYDNAWAAAAKEYGITLTEDIMGQMRGINEELLRKKSKKIFGESFDFDKFYERTNDISRETLDNNVPHQPKLVELLDFLQQSGIKMAVASSTNTATVKKYLNTAQVAHYFDAIIGGDMVTRSKPDPEIFQKAAAALGVEPSECIALEDSHNGMRSASAAKCYAIMVPDLMEATEEIMPFCNEIAHNLGEIIPIIKKINHVSE